MLQTKKTSYCKLLRIVDDCGAIINIIDSIVLERKCCFFFFQFRLHRYLDLPISNDEPSH